MKSKKEKKIDIRELVILPERFPKAGDTKSSYMCAGFNEYRNILIEMLLKH